MAIDNINETTVDFQIAIWLFVKIGVLNINFKKTICIDQTEILTCILLFTEYDNRIEIKR